MVWARAGEPMRAVAGVSKVIPPPSTASRDSSWSLNPLVVVLSEMPEAFQKRLPA